MFEKTKNKIKAIDAILSLMDKGKMKDVQWNEIYKNKLDSVVDPNFKTDLGNMINEVPVDYQKINILRDSFDGREKGKISNAS